MDLRELATLSGVVAFWLQSKWKKNSRAELSTRNGTMVIHPTEKARAFIQQWAEAGRTAPRYTDDQDAMAMAIGHVQNIVITSLDIRFTATRSDQCDSRVTLHDTGKPASRIARNLQRIKTYCDPLR